MIATTSLSKIYPGNITALDSLDLTVAEGEFFGLLGPNGAGKTTTIGILTTRVQPTGGTAKIGDIDVVAEPAAARQRIGVVPQRPNPDRGLRVRENLTFHARYFGIARSEAARRADELLQRFDLHEKRDAKVDALSGGQQQRLMIARALIHQPQVLFLDEPTVGLDPQARHSLWEILRQLHVEGKTIVMTTHYMEEADQLCERVAIIDRGKLLALDTPARLKAQAPGDTIIDLTLDGDAAALAERATQMPGVSRAEARGPLLRVFTPKPAEAIPPLLAAADALGRSVDDIQLSRPSLESLFISLTGRKFQ